jgi:dGTPase
LTGLAHDLGHPPFGHIAEETLDELAQEGDADGFEGNAQSFRIVTKLAVRSPDHEGLNLTRATLSAILKYPWFRQREGKGNKRWGAYRSETRDFEWARTSSIGLNGKSAEAELMDWADDIAYSVHDVEDFYTAGFVPLARPRKDTNELRRFLDTTFSNWNISGPTVEEKNRHDEYEHAFGEIIAFIPITEDYTGTLEQQAH